MDYLEQYNLQLKEYVDTLTIDNGGAMTIPKIGYDIEDDGDITATIALPFCGYNAPWRNSVLKLVEEIKINAPWSVCNIRLQHDKILMDLSIHTCDPD